MPEPAGAIDVSSTLAALARTLDNAGLRADLGQTTVPAPQREHPGQLEELELSGDARYETLETLGMGGMGKVDAVWNRDLMRQLALEQVHTQLANDGLSLRQFLWEARVTAHLDHSRCRCSTGPCTSCCPRPCARRPRPCSGPRATWPPSCSAVNRPTCAPTSTPSGSCSTSSWPCACPTTSAGCRRWSSRSPKARSRR